MPAEASEGKQALGVGGGGGGVVIVVTECLLPQHGTMCLLQMHKRYMSVQDTCEGLCRTLCTEHIDYTATNVHSLVHCKDHNAQVVATLISYCYLQHA